MLRLPAHDFRELPADLAGMDGLHELLRKHPTFRERLIHLRPALEIGGDLVGARFIGAIAAGPQAALGRLRSRKAAVHRQLEREREARQSERLHTRADHRDIQKQAMHACFLAQGARRDVIDPEDAPKEDGHGEQKP